MPAGREEPSISDRRHNGTGGNRPDARDRRQSLACGIALVPVNDGLLQAGNAFLRMAQLFHEWQQRLPDRRTERTVVSILDERGNFRSARLALLHDNPELGQVRPQRIHQHRVLAHQELSRPMKHQDSLLFLALQWDEPHRRARNGFTDGSGIRHVILLPLHIWLHIVRRHQLHVVPHHREFPGPVVRRCASFNADQGGLQLREERQDFSAP